MGRRIHAHPSNTTCRWIQPRVKRWMNKRRTNHTWGGRNEGQATRNETPTQTKTWHGSCKRMATYERVLHERLVPHPRCDRDARRRVVSWVRHVQTHEPSHLLSSSNAMRTCPTRIPGCKPRVPSTCRKRHSTLRTPPHEPCVLRTVATTSETTYGFKRTCARNVARLSHDASTRSNAIQTRWKEARDASEDVPVVVVEWSRARFPHETQPTQNGVERDQEQNTTRRPTKRYVRLFVVEMRRRACLVASENGREALRWFQPANAPTGRPPANRSTMLCFASASRRVVRRAWNAAVAHDGDLVLVRECACHKLVGGTAVDAQRTLRLTTRPSCTGGGSPVQPPVEPEKMACTSLRTSSTWKTSLHSQEECLVHEHRNPIAGNPIREPTKNESAWACCTISSIGVSYQLGTWCLPCSDKIRT